MKDAPQEALRRRLDGLRCRLDADLGTLAGMRALEARREEVDLLRRDLDGQLERAGRAAVIVLAGATGAGKSTLLNALAGQDIATEGVDRPTTSVPTIYAPVEAALGPLLDGLPGTPPQVVRYGADAAGPWTEQVLVDAPDLDSVAVEHHAIVRALAERADVLVIVLHPQSVVQADSVEFVDAFAGRRRLLFVLNRADELAEDSRERLLVQLRGIVAERWQAPDAPVLATSARQAKSQPNALGWSELCNELAVLVRTGALEGARRHNALGTAARLQELGAAVAATAGEDLAALPERARAGLEQLAGRSAAAVGERLELRKADLSMLLWNEAAKRWDGPGGWALRAGGLSTLGLGAGALLVRRNPLLAAGAAGASLAADKARDTVRKRRMSGADSLLPGPQEFRGWYGEALGEARLSAARLCGEPTALGLPSAEEAAASTSAAVEESWQELVEHELPRAAENSMLRWFRLPLDLPVYALAAWIVWRAAAMLLNEIGGPFQGLAGAEGASGWVGVDFLLNAALVVLVYLFVVRLVVRRALSLGAGGLLRRVVARTELQLRETAQQAGTEVEIRVGARSESLDRLRRLEDDWRAELRRDQSAGGQ